MCGIAGIWGTDSRNRLLRVLPELRHRGPDEQGVWNTDPEHPALGHCRLAIIDLEHGQQPMTAKTGAATVVFNGAIDNYPELQESLGRHNFTTSSDTETLLVAYERYGLEFLDHLHGMYALALWDHKKKRLILARDPSGKKPLYLTQVNGELAFASETRALRTALTDPPAINNKALRQYLSWGCVPGPTTIYRDIECLKPGEVVVVEQRQVTQRFVRRIHPQDPAPATTCDTMNEIESRLSRAVKLRMRADVPVGCFLSGGIDSGLITALAVEHASGPLLTLTVGFEQGGFDERSLAATVARRYKTDHHEIVIMPRPQEDLPVVARTYDQPFADSSAIPSLYVAREARKYVKVILNGDGGDELFGGYRRYNAARIFDLIPWAESGLLQSMGRTLNRMMPVPAGFRTGSAFAHRFIRGMGLPRTERYLDWSLNGFTATEINRIMCDIPGGMGNGITDVIDAHMTDFSRRSTFLDAMMAADAACVLPYDLLVKMDIACMAAGLEGRSPFMDQDLWSYVDSVPRSARVGVRQTKPMLRRLARKYLPAEVCSGPKRGFEIPLISWLQNDLRDMSHDIIMSRTGLMPQLFKRAELEALLERKWALDPGQWAKRVWILLMLGMWDRECRP